MNYSEGRMGRLFVLRLEEGEVLDDTLARFAADHAIARALTFYVGGSADGSQLVVGPDTGRPQEIVPLLYRLAGPREVLALGTIFPNEAGHPVVHMHAAAGREGDATVGCTRAGLTTWLVGEVVILEIEGTNARRMTDPSTGFELLQADGRRTGAGTAGEAAADG